MVREALTAEVLEALEPREAAAYFIARRAEGLTASEEGLLAGWLAKDETHGRIFDSTDTAWRSFDGAENNEILAAMRDHARASRRHSRSWPVAGIALALAAACALIFVIPGLNPWVTRPAPTIEYASAQGQVREIQLPDGSAMTLDADSRAVGQFSNGTRSISLERGRAYFAVRHDPTAPFTVVAASERVVVTGTRFDVNLAGEGLTVTLLEGHVNIGPERSSAQPTAMAAGQQYVERQGMASIRTVGPSGSNAISWREGLINFDDQRLDEAAEVMNRYTQDQIVIRDAGVASMRVSGQFRAGETQRFADTLAEMRNLRVVRRSNQIELVTR